MPYLSGVDASRKNIRAKGLPYSARFFFNGLQVPCCAEVLSERMRRRLRRACPIGPSPAEPPSQRHGHECAVATCSPISPWSTSNVMC